MNLSPEEPDQPDTPVDFATALRWVEGDHELLAELIGIFLEDCPKRLVELEKAVKECNATGIRQSAHSVKGMLAGFNARSAHALASEMEDLGKAGNLSKTSDLLPALLLEFSRVMHHLKSADQ